MYGNDFAHKATDQEMINTLYLFHPDSPALTRTLFFPFYARPVLNAMIGRIATICGFLLTSSVS
jgi:hypothetical protein